MSSRSPSHRRHVVPITLALCALWAGPAAAATTQFASPGGTTTASTCTDVASPCSLPVALGNAEAGDTVSLAAGSYDVQNVVHPPVRLHWIATDGATMPVLTSAGLGATVSLSGGSSGSTFEGLEIDNTSTTGLALGTDDGVDLTVRSSVLRGPHCVSQPVGDQVPGELTIEDSTLSSPVGRTCATLGSSSVLRRTVVSLTEGIATQTPPPAVVSEGLVEDAQISGGLQLLGTRAVARRVTASGWTAIFGQGLVVDSVATAIGNRGAAVAADAPRGGILRVINVTAVAPQAPALEARGVFASGESTVTFNSLVVSNTIARGAPVDLRATTVLACRIGQACEEGQIRIDHSNFLTREPAAGGLGSTIEVGTGNQSGDPLFTDRAAGDFRPRTGSPAIDAGADPQGRALPADADGHPRLQGQAIDLGAYEFSPPPAGTGDLPPTGPGTGPTDTPPPADTAPPTLGPLRLARARFRTSAGTTLTATTSEIGQLRVTIQRRVTGRTVRGRCASAKGYGRRCTRWVAVGSALSRRATAPGAVTLAFKGRVGTRRLVPDRYRFVVTAIDAAGNRSAPRTITFTVLPGDA